MKTKWLPLMVWLAVSASFLIPGSFSLAAPDGTVHRSAYTSAILDPSFGGDGKVTTDFGGYELGEAFALQPDGKIILAGYSYQYDSLNQTHYDFALSRYNPDGSLDKTFDHDGKIILDLGGQEEASGLALQPDGKIVVAGRSYKDTNYSFVLLRYNANGSLDTTFSGDGKVTTSKISGIDVAIQADGRIVVSGSSGNGVNSGFSLLRYNSNGSLDTTFDGDGKVVTYFGSSNASGGTIAIQLDGKIVVIGYSYTGPSNFAENYDFALARYNRNGSLDTTFSEDGILTTDFGGDDTASDLVLQTDGKIVVAGTRGDPNGSIFNEFALARYNSDGSLNTTFDTDGKVTLRLGLQDIGTGIVIQPDGKLLVLGSTARSINMNLHSDFALLRYNHDGSLDTTFGTDGKIILNFGSAYEAPDAVALQPDGKILLSGGITNSSTHDDFALARYDQDITAPTVTPFKSAGAADGWVLESSETSNQGGITNATAATFILGDHASNQQYRSILHFNTSSLPDNAVITKVVLKIKKHSLTGTDPFTTHLKIAVDIRQGAFSNAGALQATDFQAAASEPAVGLITNTPQAGGWYVSTLKAVAYPFINRTGVTQFRLRFQTDDDNDLVADLLRFYSGNAIAANRPVLVIEYYVP